MLQAKLDSLLQPAKLSSRLLRRRGNPGDDAETGAASTAAMDAGGGTWGSSSSASIASSSGVSTSTATAAAAAAAAEEQHRWLSELDMAGLDHLMELMCDEMGLEESRRLAIRSLPRDSKVKMLQQHRKLESGASGVALSGGSGGNMSSVSQSGSVGAPMQQTAISASSGHHAASDRADRSAPEYYIRELQWYSMRQGNMLLGVSTANLIKSLVGLRVSLTSQPLAWVKKFIALDGMAALLHILSDLHKRPKRRDKDHAVEHEIIRCIKVYMNNAFGLRNVLDERSHGTVLAVVRCMHSPNFHVRKVACELLTVICYGEVPRGHTLVLRAMETVRKGALLEASVVSAERVGASPYHRWMQLLQGVVEAKDRTAGTGSVSGGLIAGVGWIGDSRVTDKEVTDYLVSNLMLVNAIISLPEDVDFRMHLRNELYTVGFGKLKVKMTAMAHSNEYLHRQLESFAEDMRMDWEEYTAFFASLKDNEYDPQNIFKAIQRSVQGSAAEMHFRSILQHLLVVRQEPRVRANYYRLFDTLVSQIVLNGKGIDPDFTATYNVDIDQLVAVQSDAAAAEIAQLTEQTRELEQSLQTVYREKCEMEIELAELKGRLGSVAGRTSPFALPASAEDVAQYESIITSYEQTLESLLQAAPGLASLKLQPPAEVATSAVTDNGNVNKVPSPASSSANTSTTESTSPPAETTTPTPPPPGPPPTPPPPPPPPAPGAPNAAVRRLNKALYKPKTKLKQLQWQKLADVSGSIWDPNSAAGSSTTLDRDIAAVLTKSDSWRALEDHFAATTTTTAASSATGKQPDVDVAATDSTTEVAKDFTVLNPKKSHNFLILLKKMKPTMADVRKALLAMDETVIPLQLLKQVLLFLPTEEETRALQQFRGQVPPNLGMADRFFLELLQIDRFDYRVKALIFKANFDERLRDLQADTDRVLTATTAVLNDSGQFDNVMRLVLLVGNVMNGSGFRGGAYGFRLSGINAIMDTKSTSSSLFPTLLHYLANVVDTLFPQYASFVDEIAPVSVACRISTQAVVNEASVFHRELDEVARVTINAPPDDILAATFGPFVRRATMLERGLAARVERMQQQYADCLQKYGEDPAEITSEQFFSEFKLFASSFQAAMAYVRSARSKAEASKQLQQSEETLPSTGDDGVTVTHKQEEPTTDKAPARKPSSRQAQAQQPPLSQDAFVLDLSDNDKKGVMDSLLESLKRGTLTNSRSSTIGGPRRPLGPDGTPTHPWRRISISQVALQAEHLLSELQNSD